MAAKEIERYYGLTDNAALPKDTILQSRCPEPQSTGQRSPLMTVR